MIVMYSNDCPKCKILKSKLDEKNIQYTICSDIDLMISRGFRSMPMLEVDGNVKTFLEATTWINSQEAK